MPMLNCDCSSAYAYRLGRRRRLEREELDDGFRYSFLLLADKLWKHGQRKDGPGHTLGDRKTARLEAKVRISFL